MAWDSYHGRYRIKVGKPYRVHSQHYSRTNGLLCIDVNLQKKNSQYANVIGKVCQNPDGTWDDNKTLTKHRRPQGAIKTLVDHHTSYIGVRRSMDGARRRKRR